MLALLFLIGVAVVVLEVVALWQIFTKAGRPGWAALIPFYNMYVLLQVVHRPGWWVILWLIPYVGGVITVIVFVELADVFGRSGWFGVGLIGLTPVFTPILGFGASRYTITEKPAGPLTFFG